MKDSSMKISVLATVCYISVALATFATDSVYA